MLDTTARSIYSTDHEIFRAAVRRFLQKELDPNREDFDRQGRVSRQFWEKAGEAGMLCMNVEPEYGGPGLDFTFNALVNEELGYAGAADCLMLQSDVTVGYLLRYGNTAQKRRWLPGMVAGTVVSGIAMTEPGAGSDLHGIQTKARREGEHYIVNGAKTYITNGLNADLIFLVVKTETPAGAAGTSVLLVDTSLEGFRKGRKLDKVGQWSSDTAELFFDDMKVPVDCLLGTENNAFSYLVGELAQERLSISITAQAAAQRAYDEAVVYVRDRKAFGKYIIDFQNTRFMLAEIKAKLQIGWAHLDWAIKRHVSGVLTAEEAAASKLWHTENSWLIIDAAMQLHGGAGYMNEYFIARLWRDARVRRVYGGSSEIMKEIVGRAI